MQTFSRTALFLLLFSLLSPRLLAQMAYQPMGSSVQSAALIAIADTAPSGNYDTQFTFREVLKGNDSLVGHTYIRQMMDANIEGPRVPSQALAIAVLLASGWDNPKEPSDYIEEVYADPKDIAVLRTFVDLYRLPTEHERLAALQTHLHDPNPVFQQQWLQDILAMRDPADYSFITASFPELDREEQIRLIGIIGQIGDLRGVPILIQALSSPDRGIWNTAEEVLRYHFPDAPGMREAFEAALTDPNRAPWAARFLIKHEPKNPRLKSLLTPGQTLFMKAEALRKAGDRAGSQALSLKIIGDTHENYFSRLYEAKDFMSDANQADKDRLRPIVLPLLMKDVASANSLDPLSDATLLRALHHPDCLPALLEILDHPSSLNHSAIQVAVMAVRELGPEARGKAVKQTITRIKGLSAFPANKDVMMSDEAVYFAELAWLGSSSDYEAAGQALDKSYIRVWTQWLSLAGIAVQRDEGLSLVNFLQAQSEERAAYSQDAAEWVIFRLGDLRESRGVPRLYDLLTTSSYSSEGYAAAEALGKIGGSENEKMALALLTSSDKEWGRPQAVQILAQIQGPNILPLLRRMLRETDFGDKTSALRLMGQYGTPDDLKTLMPLADFWTGDRDLQRDANSAVEEIRDRYNYDIYGPMKVQ